MTLKQQIVKQLLDGLRDPSGLEEVFRKYRYSKGPFYLALAQATQQAEDQLLELALLLSERQSQRDEAQADLGRLEELCRDLERQVQIVVHRLETEEARLAEVQETLERAELLQRQGFGPAELDQLHVMFCQVVEQKDASPAEAAEAFFRVAELLGQVASLEVEITKAESRAAAAKQAAETWEAEAQSLEAQTTARRRLVQATESLLEQGLTPEDLLGWESVVRSARVTVDELNRELEQFSQISSLSESRQLRAEELERIIARRESELKGLRDQRSQVRAELQAIRNQASAELKKAGKQALLELKEAGSHARKEIESLITAAAEHSNLRQESASLKAYIQIAQSLGSDSPQVWQAIPRPIIQHLLLGIAVWTQQNGCNPELPPPIVVKRANLVPSWTRVSLRNLLLWSLSGVFSPEERQALSSGL